MTTLPPHLLPLHQQLEAMRPALPQLRNPALAEDAAQDALIAALEQKNFFRVMAWRLGKLAINTTRIFPPMQAAHSCQPY